MYVGCMGEYVCMYVCMYVYTHTSVDIPTYTPHRVLSYHTIPYHVVSHHITSYHLFYHFQNRLSVPANSVAKPPCADTPIRRRMARRGHIRRYADTTVGGLGWLTPIRAYAGTPLADMPVRGKNTPIRRSRSKYADTPIQEANTPIRRYADLGREDGTVYRCIGAGPPPPPAPPFPPPFPPPPPPLSRSAGPHQASRPRLLCPGLRQRAGKQSPVKLSNLSGFPGLGFIGFTRV